MQKNIKKEPEKTIVAEIDGNIVAFGMVYPFGYPGHFYNVRLALFPGFPYPCTATEIGKLVVDPEQQKKGYGKLVSVELEQIAAAKILSS